MIRDNANLWRYTHARASWNALRTLSTAASGPPRYSSTSFCGCGEDGRTDGVGDNDKIKDQQSAKREAYMARNDYRRTIKIAFGMPRGFFSPSWMMSSGAFEVDMLSFAMSESSVVGKTVDKDKEKSKSNL